MGVCRVGRVIVGMSGGVDSATAAFLLREAGHDVIGVTFRTWSGGGSRCCEIDEARNTARKLNIPYHVLNCVSDFRKNVEAPFIEDYLRGLTPNPCVICNREVKWARLLYAAELFGADMVATGHYASAIRLENGRYAIQKAADVQKDQSYMLYRLTQEQLSRTVLPLGGLTKTEVRRIAEQAGIPSASRPDSQEICFVTEGSYADYIEAHAERELPGAGAFVDEQGNVLGKHRGIIRYTVGQRKGLGLSLGRPVYVKDIRPETNEVVIADENSLYRTEILCGRLNFMSLPGIAEHETIRATVKIRYRHEGAEAALNPAYPGRVLVRFANPVRAATPGQSAVFYDSANRVIGGGVILPSDASS